MTAQNIDRVPRIVVGVDGSPSSRTALRWAVRQAELTGATLDAVIAWQYPAHLGTYGWAPVAMQDQGTDYCELAEKALTEAINAVVDPASDVTVRPRAAHGNPAQVLLDAARGADLLVVGSRGHSGFTGALLGSVSQHCVHHSPCPVAVIRGHLPG
jgi:nucleotide-binding universal stress UspA family protein